MDSEDTVTSAAAPPEGGGVHTLPPGWSRPLPEELPELTYWPAVMALGIVLFAWGFVTTFVITGIGLILMVTALKGWIGDIRHEQQRS